MSFPAARAAGIRSSSPPNSHQQIHPGDRTEYPARDRPRQGLCTAGKELPMFSTHRTVKLGCLAHVLVD